MKDITNKLIHYDTRKAFEKDRSRIPFTSIVFIDEDRTIYTHGTEYNSSDVAKRIDQIDQDLIDMLNKSHQDLLDLINELSKYVEDMYKKDVNEWKKEYEEALERMEQIRQELAALKESKGSLEVTIDDLKARIALIAKYWDKAQSTFSQFEAEINALKGIARMSGEYWDTINNIVNKFKLEVNLQLGTFKTTLENLDLEGKIKAILGREMDGPGGLIYDYVKRISDINGSYIENAVQTWLNALNPSWTTLVSRVTATETALSGIDLRIKQLENGETQVTASMFAAWQRQARDEWNDAISSAISGIDFTSSIEGAFSEMFAEYYDAETRKTFNASILAWATQKGSGIKLSADYIDLAAMETWVRGLNLIPPGTDVTAYNDSELRNRITVLEQWKTAKGYIGSSGLFFNNPELDSRVDLATDIGLMHTKISSVSNAGTEERSKSQYTNGQHSYWLKNDGSGQLAWGAITWDANGNLNYTDKFYNGMDPNKVPGGTVEVDYDKLIAKMQTGEFTIDNLSVKAKDVKFGGSNGTFNITDYSQLGIDVTDLTTKVKNKLSLTAGDIDFTTGTYTISSEHLNIDTDSLALTVKNRLSLTANDIDFNVSGTWKITGSHIDMNGIYIDANNVTGINLLIAEKVATQLGAIEALTAGTSPNQIYINGTDGIDFQNGKIKIAVDGSGWVANKNITWDASGNVTINNATLKDANFTGSTLTDAINGNTYLSGLRTWQQGVQNNYSGGFSLGQFIKNAAGQTINSKELIVGIINGNESSVKIDASKVDIDTSSFTVTADSVTFGNKVLSDILTVGSNAGSGTFNKMTLDNEHLNYTGEILSKAITCTNHVTAKNVNVQDGGALTMYNGAAISFVATKDGNGLEAGEEGTSITHKNITTRNLTASYLTTSRYLDVTDSVEVGTNTSSNKDFCKIDGSTTVWTLDTYSVSLMALTGLAILDNNTTVVRLSTSGNIEIAGQLTQNSDERLKTITNNIDVDIQDIANTRIVDYVMKSGKGDGTMSGAIAQDWQNILPNVVKETEDGYLSLNYAGAALVSAVEAAREIVKLKEENASLKAQIAKIIEKIGGID